MSEIEKPEEGPRQSSKRAPDLNTVYSINEDGSRNFIQVADVKGKWTTRKYAFYAALILKQ